MELLTRFWWIFEVWEAIERKDGFPIKLWLLFTCGVSTLFSALVCATFSLPLGESFPVLYVFFFAYFVAYICLGILSKKACEE